MSVKTAEDRDSWVKALIEARVSPSDERRNQGEMNSEADDPSPLHPNNRTERLRSSARVILPPQLNELLPRSLLFLRLPSSPHSHHHPTPLASTDPPSRARDPLHPVQLQLSQTRQLGASPQEPRCADET